MSEPQWRQDLDRAAFLAARLPSVMAAWVDFLASALLPPGLLEAAAAGVLAGKAPAEVFPDRRAFLESVEFQRQAVNALKGT